MTIGDRLAGLMRMRDRQGRRLMPVLHLVIALVTALVLLVGAAGSVLWLALRADRQQQWIEQTLEIERRSADLLAALRGAESGARGFVLTEEERYLDPYAAIPRQIDGLLGQLAERASGERRGHDVVNALRTLIQRQLDHLAEVVALARAGDFAAAVTVIDSDRGQAQMEQIRDRLSAFRAGERDRLSEARERSDVATRNLLIAVAVALVGVLLAVILAWAMVRRSVSALWASEAELSALNASLEETVSERTAELDDAMAEVQRFAYIVSHDLRSPLVNIMGFTNELQASLETLRALITRLDETSPGSVGEEERLAIAEDVPEALRYILTSTSKMDRLINAILKLSREGRRTLTRERLNLTVLAEGVAETLHMTAEQRNAEITVGTLPEVWSDRIAIEQILANLMENAVKYGAGDRNNRIVVSGTETAGRVRLSVTDSGRGIPESDRQRVFDLFRRSGAQDQPGEGIGLAVVRSVVRRLGGDITFTSTPGEGTTFIVDLPKVSVAQEREKAA